MLGEFKSELALMKAMQNPPEWNTEPPARRRSGFKCFQNQEVK